MAFFAVMAAIGILTTATALSWPIYWVIEHTLVPVCNYLQERSAYWMNAYRD